MEKICITEFIWVMISNSFSWMISVNGCGSCGSALSRQEAIKKILNSSRLSDKQKSIIENSRVKKSGEQLELF